MSDFAQMVGGHPTDASCNFTKCILIPVSISSVVFAFWRSGALGSLPMSDREGVCLLGCLVLYALSGFTALIQQNWAPVKYMRNSPPMWAICFIPGDGPRRSMARAGKTRRLAQHTPSRRLAAVRMDFHSYLVGAIAQTSAASFSVPPSFSAHCRESGTPRPFDRDPRRRD